MIHNQRLFFLFYTVVFVLMSSCATMRPEHEIISASLVVAEKEGFLTFGQLKDGEGLEVFLDGEFIGQLCLNKTRYCARDDGNSLLMEEGDLEDLAENHDSEKARILYHASENNRCLTCFMVLQAAE